MKPSPIITLLTDFGTRDPYVAAMKGTILRICTDAKIVDISHEVPKFNIKHAAFLLLQTIEYFPEGTIHVVVVDPGVGTSRRRIIIETKKSFFIGPDNGVLIPAAEREGISQIIEIKSTKYMLSEVSKTFEGRDVFAPVAAHLASGTPLESFGNPMKNVVKHPFPSSEVSKSGISGEVVHIDGFGNLITNINKNHLRVKNIKFGEAITVSINDRTHKIPFLRTYGDSSKGEYLAIIGSSGLLEISINQGNAANDLGVGVGVKIFVTK
ncbi:MAG: S-adenosyl-l-methionine hydroxide adenosyltransferase family protein [Candidatus Hodarchaeota archaeon]